MYKTLKEASEFLGVSEKTISRCVKRGILHPDKVATATGQTAYRFLTAELGELRDRTDKTGHKTGQRTGQDRTPEQGFYSEDQTDKTGQKTGHRTDKTGQSGHPTTDERAFLYGQIEQKDRQIEHLSRQVTMYAMQNSQLQNRLLELPAPEGSAATKTAGGRVDKSLVFWGVCLAVVAVVAVYTYLPELITLLKGAVAR